MVHIELDTVNFYDRQFQIYLKEHKISTLVVSFKGPAGGAMVIKYYGTIRDIVNMVNFYWTDAELLTQMEIGDIQDGQDNT